MKRKSRSLKRVLRSGAAREVCDGGDELGGLDRFGAVNLKTGEHRPSAVFGAGEGGEGDGGGLAPLLGRQLADAADQLVAVDLGHADVAHDHVETLLAEDLQRLAGVGGEDDFALAMFQDALEQVASVG